MIFANPWGALALLGLPVVLAIHFFQQPARPLVINTLFLLEAMTPRSVQGARWEKLRSSVPLWLQLLSVCLVAWLLLQPQWVRTDSSQRVVVVVDSSFSMSAFTSERDAAAARELGRVARWAAKTEWVLIESDATQPTRYVGSNLSELLRGIATIEPKAGTQDWAAVWSLAEQLRGRQGLVVVLTDHKIASPEGVGIVAVGRPLPNCGWAGLRVVVENGTERWKVLVRNYCDQPQQRAWWLEAEGQATPKQTLQLAAGQTLSLEGEFPPKVTGCELKLTSDDFALDDVAPLVRPVPKVLRWQVEAGSKLTPLLESLANSVTSSQRVQEAPDVIFRTYAAGSTGTVSGSSVVIVTDDGAASRYFSGLIVGEPHRLVTDLNWQGLVAQESLGLQLRETDEPLLRQGSRVLAFVRRQDKVPQLFINFDVAKSNASRLPALVLLVHRFVEDLRAEKVGWERSNVELSQPLTVAAKTNEPLVLEEKNTKHSEAVASGGVRAPSHPSFFTIKQGKEVLMEGAATFAEVREADFRSAESVVSLESVVQVAQRRNVQADPLAAWWVLGLLALLLTVWGWSARGSS